MITDKIINFEPGSFSGFIVDIKDDSDNFQYYDISNRPFYKGYSLKWTFPLITTRNIRRSLTIPANWLNIVQDITKEQINKSL